VDDRDFGLPISTGCPHCGGAAPKGAVECAGCGLVFAKWKARAGAPTPRPADAPGSLESWRRKRLAAGAKGAAWFCAVLLVVWAALRPPAGLPASPEALADPERGFAVALPPGWTVVRRNVARGETVLAVEASPEGSDAWLSAVVVEGDGLPDGLAPGKRDGLPRLLGEAFPGASGDLSYTKPTRVRVDNLKALRLEGDGSRTLRREVQSAVSVDPWVQRMREAKGLPPAPVEFVSQVVEDSRRLRFVVQAVPGAGRRFAVGVIGDQDAFLARKPEVEAWLASFRVTERPLSPAHLAGLAVRTLKGEFIQQTVVTAILLLWALSRWLFSPLTSD
jgi:hypothetical protein